MDLRIVLFDRDVMQTILRDSADDVAHFPVQMPLFGKTPLHSQADTAPVAAKLELYGTDADTPTWQLQWILLVLIYLSDRLSASLQQGTPHRVFNAWFYGTAHTRVPAFRERFERALGGTYGGKTKRGCRKDVSYVARTCLESTIDEVLLLHLIVGQG